MTGQAGQVVDINPGSQSTDPYYPTFNPIGDKLYFSGYFPGYGNELLYYDVTSNTASMAADINPGSSGSYPSQLTWYNGSLYFTANTPELWHGIMEILSPLIRQSSLVGDPNPGTASSYPNYLTVWDNQLWFSANNGVSGKELWYYSSTTNTFTQVADINTGSANSSPAYLTAAADSLYFSANNGVTGFELWSVSKPANQPPVRHRPRAPDHQ